MESQFRAFIDQNHLCSKDDKILLAVSGGMDSMCMSNLFFKLNYSIGIAHVNHGLRGAESDDEELSVKSWAIDRGIPFYSVKVDVKGEMKKSGKSLQESARKLRYEFLNSVANGNAYQYIATAHHADDSTETVFFHLLRGTGLKGLRGIPMKRSNIVRPLLFAKRSEIAEYMTKNEFRWKEDSSNKGVDYTRNKIRNELLPLMEDKFPGFKEGLVSTAKKANEAWNFIAPVLEKTWLNIIEQKDGNLSINIEKLKEVNSPELMLAEYLPQYGFSSDRASEVMQLLHSESGKQLLSSSHKLVRDRKQIFILPVEIKEKDKWFIKRDLSAVNLPVNMRLDFVELSSGAVPDYSLNTTWLNADLLEFPLTLRYKQDGDWFKPLGMKGKQKLSDFMILQKVPVHEKERILLLCSGDRIVWVLGRRIDEDFKITALCSVALKITL